MTPTVAAQEPAIQREPARANKVKPAIPSRPDAFQELRVPRMGFVAIWPAMDLALLVTSKVTKECASRLGKGSRRTVITRFALGRVRFAPEYVTELGRAVIQLRLVEPVRPAQGPITSARVRATQDLVRHRRRNRAPAISSVPELRANRVAPVIRTVSRTHFAGRVRAI